MMSVLLSSMIFYNVSKFVVPPWVTCWVLANMSNLLLFTHCFIDLEIFLKFDVLSKWVNANWRLKLIKSTTTQNPFSIMWSWLHCLHRSSDVIISYRKSCLSLSTTFLMVWPMVFLNLCKLLKTKFDNLSKYKC